MADIDPAHAWKTLAVLRAERAVLRELVAALVAEIDYLHTHNGSFQPGRPTAVALAKRTLLEADRG